MVPFSVILGIYLLVVSLDLSDAKKLPSFITYCRQSDPKINECVQNALNDMRPHLKDGVSEFAIPPLAPLLIPGGSLDGAFKVAFTNLTVDKIDSLFMERVKMDLDKNHIEFDLRFPSILVEYWYTLDGNLLVFTLHSVGKGNANITDMIITVDYTGTRHAKNGKEYMIWDQRKVWLEVPKAEIFFERLFGDNQELNDHTNQIFNENFQELFNELRPIATKFVEGVFFRITDRIFERYSINELFP